MSQNKDGKCTQSHEIEPNESGDWGEDEEKTKEDVDEGNSEDHDGMGEESDNKGHDDPGQSEDGTHNGEHDISHVSSGINDLLYSFVNSGWTIAVFGGTTLDRRITSNIASTVVVGCCGSIGCGTDTLGITWCDTLFNDELSGICLVRVR